MRPLKRSARVPERIHRKGRGRFSMDATFYGLSSLDGPRSPSSLSDCRCSTLTRHTSVCGPLVQSNSKSYLPIAITVQYAGNSDPFQVTLILSCVQIISMILTSTLTDQFGRRPLTVYPYGVTALSLLCLGIIGCFDYTQPSLSSLLVSELHGINFSPQVLTKVSLFPDLLCLFSNIFYHRCLRHRLRICS